MCKWQVWFRRAVGCGFAMAALFLAGCAAVRPSVSEMQGLQSDVGALVLFDAASQPIRTLLGAATRDSALDILVLSGGGADGAFGAGVLIGWSETKQRPHFDIVTGVSTGALIATFAFLGSRYDAQLKSSYTELKGSDIYDPNGFLAPFTDDALFDNAPLRRTLAKVVTPAVIDAVAAEHRTGRRLYVATTNLDRGELLVWDLGAIAASGDPARYEVYREIVRASTAVPGIFTPVFLKVFTAKGPEVQMHVDGGIKTPLLLRDFMLRGNYARKTVYVIANAQLSLNLPPVRVAPRYAAIAARAIGELYRGLLYRTLFQAYVGTRHANAEFRMVSIPEDVAATKNALRFDAAEMAPLFEIGRKIGLKGPQAWQKEPPRLDDLERIDE